MQFNSHASNFDIVSDIDFLADSDANSYPIAKKTRNVNLGYDRVVSLVLSADGRWPFDDANASDLPTGTISLVAGTQKYDLGAGVSTFLNILRVSVKDSSGQANFLEEMSLSDFNGRDPMDATQASGTPTGYFKYGEYLVFDKIPDYSSTNGIKLYTQKNVSYFTTSDTTKEPGFAAPFHRLLSLYAARDYCAVNDMDRRLVKLENEIKKLETELVLFYSRRAKDDQPRLRMRRENYGAEEPSMGASNTIS